MDDLGVSRSTLDRLVKADLVTDLRPVKKRGKPVLYDKAQLLAALGR